MATPVAARVSVRSEGMRLSGGDGQAQGRPPRAPAAGRKCTAREWPQPDAVGFGGWAIDLHPADRAFSDLPSAIQYLPRSLYPVPYRCLYSCNVGNLFLAGRLISASHVAFGSLRVMATLWVRTNAPATLRFEWRIASCPGSHTIVSRLFCKKQKGHGRPKNNHQHYHDPR